MKKEQDNINLNTDKALSKTIIHDKTYSTLVRRWFAMKSRCYDQNNPAYKNYGGRGIKVCDEWLYNFESYYYWCINNGYKQNLEIDRINNDGNYEPSNCRFVTRQENINNRRCSKKQADTEITKGIKEPLAL